MLSPEAIAGLEEMFERWRLRTPTTESAQWMEQISAAVRIENQAVAAQLSAIGGLFRSRLAQCSETEDWAIDTMEAVAAEVAAGLRISQRLAAERVGYARAMQRTASEGRAGVRGRGYRLSRVYHDRVAHRSDC